MPEPISPRWSFFIDRGGTFTDIVAIDPAGQTHTHKLLSDNPAHYDDAAYEGIRQVLGLTPEQSLPTQDIKCVYLGTTLATNALLEQTGAPVLWITHSGLIDALSIAHQNRPNLFDPHPAPRITLYAQSHGIEARHDRDGQIEGSMDEKALIEALTQAQQSGIRSVAVSLMHSLAHPGLEQHIGHIASGIGFKHISLSHQVSPFQGWIDRSQTTLIDAYLSPLIHDYATSLHGQLNPPGCAHRIDIKFLKSDGRLCDADHFRGHQAVLSGPAGGLVGCVQTAQALGIEKVIGFDMGGTSTDVAYSSGDYTTRIDQTIHGLALKTPMLDIHTVAAGGGSCVTFDGQRLLVGPRSAGALPGPACYGLGGPLTLTDCNVVLGRIQPLFMPKKFGPDGRSPIKAEPALALLNQLAQTIRSETGIDKSPLAIAQGSIDIAVGHMANAIKQVSAQRGHTLRDAVLNCYGGAGAQHAIDVAERLGIERVMVHALGGVLSAYGLSVAETAHRTECPISKPLDEIQGDDLGAELAAVEKAVIKALIDQGIASRDIQIKRRARLRYHGSETELILEWATLPELQLSFEREHHQRFGMIQRQGQLILEAVSIEALGPSQHGHRTLKKNPNGLSVNEPVRVFFHDRWLTVPTYRLDDLMVDEPVAGPCLVIGPHTTLVVPPDWSVHRSLHETLLAERNPAITDSLTPMEEAPGVADPIELEIFNALFSAATEHMGTVLAQTAWSANIKERLDFSCALFTHQGELVANAPHVPVHLGSMGASVQRIRERFQSDMKPGDGYLLNDPYNGGTHLPDLTLVRPVFNASGQCLYFLASRAHHADIGGLTPGSMPPHSKSLMDEGVVIEPIRIQGNDQIDVEIFETLLRNAPYPARNRTQNVADLSAQAAANWAGQMELTRLLDHYGQAHILDYMQHVLDLGDHQTRQAIRQLDLKSPSTYRKVMDNGLCVQVTVSKKTSETLVIDFSGTSEQHSGNFNAPIAITRACVLYVMRLLVAHTMPLNDGCLRPVELIVPKGSFLNPEPPAAVVAGNVETSQVVTDSLLAALGLMANGPGTMANVTFGNGDYQHYETLCGGGGASATHAGSTGFHVHMTNSRLTDPEHLETRFPVTLEAFKPRIQSGGAGQHRGGDGICRIIRFNEPMTVSMLQNTHQQAPQGLMGGEPGQPACATLMTVQGNQQGLSGCCSVEVEAGDALCIETPGGGGFGSPVSRHP